MLYYDTVDSPVGKLHLAADQSALKVLSWTAPDFANQVVSSGENRILSLAKKELAAYFSGELQRFSTPLALEGTDFQKRVWACLLQIPYGETRSYQDLAIQLNKPAAARAVGGASNKNPICIMIPCHRVIGKNGNLTGFAGGMENKRYLLELEQNILKCPDQT